MWPHLTKYDHIPFVRPTSLDPRDLRPPVINSLIRVARVLGFSLWTVSWIRPAWQNVGWVGIVSKPIWLILAQPASRKQIP